MDMKKRKIGKGVLKATWVLALLGGLYFGANYAMDLISNNSISLNSITRSIDDKYKVRENIQKVIENAKLAEKRMISQFKESEIGQKIIVAENSLEKKISELRGYGDDPPPMSPLFLHGKSLDDHFRELDELNPQQQEYLAKSLNHLSAWELVLLSRYVPVDGILRELSSFYSIDYKWHVQSLLSESILDPMKIGPTDDRGLGQITPSSEKWARDLYNMFGYKFPGPKITNSILDPYTNLVLSAIIFRKDSEEKVLDFEALYSLYSNGFKGVKKNKEGFYVTNDFGIEDVNRAEKFSPIADKLITFSWMSMEKPELAKYIEDKNLRKVVEANNSAYDAGVAYEDMIDFLKSMSANKKYSKKDIEVFKSEITSASTWLKDLYGLRFIKSKILTFIRREINFLEEKI
jgi:hypothetical protein